MPPTIEQFSPPFQRAVEQNTQNFHAAFSHLPREFHFSRVQPNFRTEIQPICNEIFSLFWHCSTFNGKQLSIHLLPFRLDDFTRQFSSLTSGLLFMLSANTRGEKAGSKMGMILLLMFCNCKPTAGQKLSCNVQYHWWASWESDLQFAAREEGRFYSHHSYLD